MISANAGQLQSRDSRGICSNWSKLYVKGNQELWSLILPKYQIILAVEKIMLRQKWPLSERFYKETAHLALVFATQVRLSR